MITQPGTYEQGHGSRLGHKAKLKVDKLFDDAAGGASYTAKFRRCLPAAAADNAAGVDEVPTAVSSTALFVAARANPGFQGKWVKTISFETRQVHLLHLPDGNRRLVPKNLLHYGLV